MILPSPRLQGPGEGALNRAPRGSCVKRVPPRTAARRPTGPHGEEAGHRSRGLTLPGTVPFSGSASAELRRPESEGPPDGAHTGQLPGPHQGRAVACIRGNTGASPQVSTPVTIPTAHTCSPHPVRTGAQCWVVNDLIRMLECITSSQHSLRTGGPVHGVTYSSSQQRDEGEEIIDFRGLFAIK